MKRIATTAAIVMAVAALASAQSKGGAEQQAQILQALLSMQAANAGGHAQAPQQLSPQQMQLLIQALNSPEGQKNPAATAQLISMLAAAQPGAATVSQNGVAITVRHASGSVLIPAHARETVFVKSKSNDVADALKAQAMSEALSVGAAAAAQKLGSAVPYLGTMGALSGGMKMFGSGKIQGFDFDFVRGSAAAIEVSSAGLELFLPAGTAVPAGFEPVLVRLRASERDKVRIMSARKVRLAPSKQVSAFGGGAEDGFDREILSVENEAVPLRVLKNPDGSVVATPAQPLANGEYAVVFQRTEPKSFHIADQVFDFRVAN